MKKGLLLLAAAGMVLSSFAAPTMPESGKYYKVKHSSGLYLTRAGLKFNLAEADNANDGQFFFFEKNENGSFSLECADGYYVGSDNKWSAVVLHGTEHRYAQYDVTAVDGQEYLLFQNLGQKWFKGADKAFLGCDKNEAGEFAYTDKPGNDGKHYWTVEAAAADYEFPAITYGEDKYAQYTLPEGDPRANKHNGYKLVFAEEFNAADGQPSKDIWTYEKGFKRNNEAQYYWDKEQNIWFEEGAAVFNGKREEEGVTKNPNYNPFNPSASPMWLEWTSASIITKGGWNSSIAEGTELSQFSWLFGIYEVRAKVPAYTGCWPAIWTTGRQWSWPKGGEIDLMEWYGNKIHGNVCWWGGTGNGAETWNGATVDLPTLKKVYPDWADTYHVWQMVWEYDHMEMWCDDVLVNYIDLDTTQNAPGSGEDDWNGKNPFRDVRNILWLNLALGGNSGGSLTNCPDNNFYLVDYARVYQKIGTDGAAQYHVEEWAPDATIINPTKHTSGIGNVAVDQPDVNAPAEYFNLQGIRINEPAEGQVVIRREGNKVEKLAF